MEKDIRKGRMLSLDVMRGITIAAMIMVNNPGTWSHVYAPLRHAEWNGLTPTDLVFPFFMFIMGISSYMSLRKYGFHLSKASVWKVLRRTVLIFLIGLALAWFGLFLNGIASEATLAEAVFSFDRIRILGVLPRLALAYGIAAIIALACGGRRLAPVTIGLLVLYAIILIVGNGWEFSENNILVIVDRTVLGVAHMYTDYVGGVSMKFDPEGLLGTLPSVAHVLIGFMAGKMIMETKDNSARSLMLFILGTCLTFAGFLLAYGMPVNKKIWSPTFVLVTCGLASLLMGLLTYVIDVKERSRWCGFFEVFGVNPLALYVLAAILSILSGFIRVPFAEGSPSVYSWIFQGLIVPVCGECIYLASLIYALLFVGVVWLAGLVLYRHKIYIKI